MARAIRIHRWADAPNELRRLIDPSRRQTWDWLADVPAHRRQEAEGGFGWTKVLEVNGPDGSLIVAGKEGALP